MCVNIESLYCTLETHITFYYQLYINEKQIIVQKKEHIKIWGTDKISIQLILFLFINGNGIFAKV